MVRNGQKTILLLQKSHLCFHPVTRLMFYDCQPIPPNIGLTVSCDHRRMLKFVNEVKMCDEHINCKNIISALGLLGRLKIKMADFDLEFLMEKYQNKTVLGISPKIIKQITAEKLAREEMVRVGARPPPQMSDITYIGSIKKFSVIGSGLTWCMNIHHHQKLSEDICGVHPIWKIFFERHKENSLDIPIYETGVA